MAPGGASRPRGRAQSKETGKRCHTRTVKDNSWGREGMVGRIVISGSAPEHTELWRELLAVLVEEVQFTGELEEGDERGGDV